jgi:hypothetical protein
MKKVIENYLDNHLQTIHQVRESLLPQIQLSSGLSVTVVKGNRACC